MRRITIVVLVLTLSGLILGRCDYEGVDHSKNDMDTLPYSNLYDTVAYVGKEMCSGCHASIAQTFSHTGMGQSFGQATREKSAGDFSGDEVIHDPHLNLSYRPIWLGDDLFIEEFRIEGGDTTHQRIQKVDYIVGSGQHTNSHIYNVNGYLYQAPFTYYTQKGVLDLPPGFENGMNTRFSRMIGLECMSCHNAMPTEFVIGSENRFRSVPNGIDCERCHGPGGEHVRKIQAGRITDTSVAIDHSIVNPSKLPVDRQFMICQRCHLQGNAVLKEGRSFLDFRPGMDLSDVMDIYMARNTESQDAFIMASHVDRFKMSKCFIAGKGKFMCTSCHDPHVSVRETKIQGFNTTCKKCHSSTGDLRFGCSVKEDLFKKEEGNCVSCHMPSSGSTDIPHVSVHDHFIRIPSEQKPVSEGDFIKLESINNPSPGLRSRVRAYLQYFERFDQETRALDSAGYLLKKADPDINLLYEKVLFLYLKGDLSGIVGIVEDRGKDSTLFSLKLIEPANRDAWTAYRISEGYQHFEDLNNAQLFLEKAIELAPFQLEFIQKYGTLLSKKGDLLKAAEAFERVLIENPNIPEAHNNLGFIQLRMGNIEKGRYHLDRAIDLDPDYVQALLNKASFDISIENWEEAKELLQRVQNIAPDDQKVLSALDYVNSQLKNTP